MQIAIFGNTNRPVVLSYLQMLFDFLKDKNVKCLLDSSLYTYAEVNGLSLANSAMIENDAFEADLALSIGGDGTFLKTAAYIGNKQIPILGINTGRLGFLTNSSDDTILPAIEQVLQKQYQTEARSLLFVETSDGKSLQYPYALNEVAVLKQDTSSMIAVSAMVNGEPVHTYQSDGLILSTPTGSTAYSMSVGGPIVVPQAQSIILSPVASHSLNVRPLIIPDSWMIELEVDSRTGSFLLALDGRSQVLEQTTKLRITKAKHTINIITQPDHTFFDTLKNKLMWGVDKRTS